jgi:hypothetical protein
MLLIVQLKVLSYSLQHKVMPLTKQYAYTLETCISQASGIVIAFI